MPIEIITTSDGSHSLRNTMLNETYHSVHGAIQESMHVFIHFGLADLVQRRSLQSVRILEVGFGTGLNALLTFFKSNELSLQLYYVSIEAFPIGIDTALQLNYSEKMERADNNDIFSMLHTSPWDTEQKISDRFTLLKRHTTLQHVSLERESFDLIYFDAFAPAKQPELWELPILAKIERCMSPDGTFVTYCAKGQLKRDLKSLGLRVETLQGPPGKKEMVRAIKPGASSH